MAEAAKKLIPFEAAELPCGDLEQAIRKSRDFLLSLQQPDGHWEGELTVDATLCCDTILYMHWCGKDDPDLQEKCAGHIRRRQAEDGGWNIFIGGPSEINASIKAYFALKLAGDPPNAPWMREARANILRLGGIPQMNTYGRLYLALLGQFPWEYVPTIPPEIFLLPDWFFFNVYEMSSWSRTIIAPLAILNHFKPTRTLPSHLHLHELYPAGLENTDLSLKKDERFWAWRNFFLRCDAVLKLYNRFPFHPLRSRALRKAEKWMTERMGEGSEGLSAIFPAMLNAMMALRVLGYAEDHPLMKKAWRDFSGLFVEDDGDFRIQPCLSPVWDTAITTIALGESGVGPRHPALRRAADWLEQREVRFRGDWSVRMPDVEPSGWAFEHDNKFYPDTDDTMMVLMALSFVEPEDEFSRKAIVDRALNWLMKFQCRDGGWAAFDKDVTASWLEHVPFADHNAILDPTCSDLTARVLELLGKIGHDPRDPAVLRAVNMLRRTQEADGSWYGRWGVNYIYGTWQALRGLAAIGTNMEEVWIRRGRDWLESCQNDDGGWGETCESYNFPALKGRGPSTASQTAWALMGLCACGDASRDSIQKGIEWLVREQNEDGSWTEDYTTGTGFPCVFYLKYDMYRNHFPLLALATYRRMLGGAR
ncbi:MAG: squalene--hopene cyclase [Verrucomicrobiaceae bacterium]|nr:MAG: squalene--hopene cyclase [Verrucomicrobiaceae bacterium]